MLADIDRARPRQLAGHCRADQRAAEHAVGNPLLEHGRLGVFSVQVHRVVVTRHGGEQLDIALFDGFAEAGSLAHFKRFVRGVGYLGHLKVHPVA